MLGMLLVALIGLGGSVGQSALAAILSSTSQPLPGSQFQGADGNQDNDTAAGLIDWQGLQADGVVKHISDPNANDNVFGGGDKEGSPDQWTITTSPGGATPASGNILDTYQAVDRPQGGDAFLYLAFTRAAAAGTVFVTFELNQDSRVWTNSAGARIPCRTTGDVLITFGPQGNQAETVVERWVTDTKAANGCAKTGHLDLDTKLTAADVQASFNNSATPIANYLPGFYNGTIDTQLFGEAAVNLTSLVGQIGDPCVVFASTWMHSRSSSSSDSAALKDYVAPVPLKLASCKASPSIASLASGTVRRTAHGKHRLRRHRSLRSSPSIFDTATLSDGINPTGTLTFRLFGPNDGDCSGPAVFTFTATVVGNGSYRSGSFSPTAAGTYRWVVDYSGDINNDRAGPTACGKDVETIVIDKATPSLSSIASGGTQLQPTRQRPHRRLATTTATQDIYDTADLEGALSPSGALTFRLYGPGDPTCSNDPAFTSVVPVAANGTINSAAFTPTAAGTYRWRVSYSGDSNNEPAGPTECGIDAETVVVAKARPAIVTVASHAVTLGDSIMDGATLSDGARPTGKIEFKLYGPNDSSCSRDPIDTSTAEVFGNGTYNSGSFTPKAVGAYRWIATYTGDSDNEGAATSCGDLGEEVVVYHGPPPPAPNLTTAASPGAPAGTPVHDTATLSGGSDPTGTITFRVYGPGDPSCAREPAAISSVPVHGNGSYDSEPFTPAAAGTYLWVASYSGDDNNGQVDTHCDDPGESVVVARADPAIRTVGLRKRPVGLGVHDVARLTGGADPRGRIIFRLYGPGDATCSRPPAFRVVQRVIGNGLYLSPKVTPQQAGIYRWVAVYTGDRNNNRAGTACGDSRETVVVLPRRPALSTSASPPAYLRVKAPRAQTSGNSIYDAAALTHGLAPTGEITFALYGPGDVSCSRTPLFTSAVVVNGNGIYNSAAFTPIVSGTYRWVATYSGDANNRGTGPTGCGDSAEQVQVTVPADPILTTSASQAVTIGGAIHDTAHLSYGDAPTGTITFRLYAPHDTSCTGAAVSTSTVKVVGNGDYDSQSVVPKQAGSYQWAAEYSGDSRNHGAGPTACDDTAEIAVVRPAAILPVVVSFSTTASVSPGLGAPLTDVAHLSGGIVPFGTITFSLFGPDDPTCSRRPAFTSIVPVNGDGDYASAPFNAPAAGSYRWVATYSGDAVNAAAGPTACGDPAETSTVSADPGPVPEHGPNVPAPPKGSREPTRKVKPPSRPPPPAPVFTG
jgi:hypothetical protein